MRRLDWSRPLQALADARMLKAEFEIGHVRRSSRMRTFPLRQWSPNRIEERTGSDSSIDMCAQGDILLERVADAGEEIRIFDPDVVILAHGELSGHRHTVRGRVRLVYDAKLACDMPEGLYVGHLHVTGGPARLEHEQHGAIALQTGIYRVRRQRHLEPSDADIVED
jgi:hypothetical protein